MDSELERFKPDIDLRVFCTSEFSYQLDRKESWAGSAVMRGPNNEKVAIKRDVDGHWVYYSFRDDADNGSILDLLRKHRGLSLGQARVQLRKFMSQPPRMAGRYPPLVAVPKNRIAVERACMRLPLARTNAYLETERQIPRHVLESRRFLGRIRCNAFGSAVFPHYGREGLSGFEIKGPAFTSFSKGGTKTLWTSNVENTDNRIAFFESSIDGLSFASLFPNKQTRFASLGGKPTPLQKELVRDAIAVMPRSSTVLAAMDADVAGRAIAKIVEDALISSGRSDIRFMAQEPKNHKDWNEMLLDARRRTPVHAMSVQLG